MPRKEYQVNKIKLLCSYLKDKDDFVGVNKENYLELAAAMEIANPEEISDKRGRRKHLDMLYEIFRTAKKNLRAIGAAINGPNLAMAIKTNFINPNGFEWGMIIVWLKN